MHKKKIVKYVFLLVAFSMLTKNFAYAIKSVMF
jgi:hypothetical protein